MPPPLEPEPAIVQYLANTIFGALSYDTDDVLESCKETRGVDLKRDDRARVVVFANQISYLYDALIDWMGPGGDPAFLDFYLLANGRLPPLELVRRRLSGSIGENHMASGPPQAEIDYHRNVERRGRTAVHWGSTLIVCLPRVEFAHNKGRDYFFSFFFASPEEDYRTDLMGELAEPWSPRDDKSKELLYMRPRRHVLPLDRPYDESGYLLP